MKLWTTLRIYAFLRRGAVAAERCALALESISANLEALVTKDKPRKPQLTSFGELDIDAATKIWRKRQEENFIDEEPK